MHVSVIGCGRWGSFLAWYAAAYGGHAVTLYGRPDSSHFAALRAKGGNELLSFGPQVAFSSDLPGAVQAAQVVLVSINAQGLRGLMRELCGLDFSGKTILLCMKGIEVGTGLRLTQVVRQFLPRTALGIWVGPGHVQDFLRGIPNCMVVDSEDEAVKQRAVQAFGSKLIRFYFGDDLLGNEVGAAAKNVIGIAAGMLDGLDKSALKGALMSRGTREIARLIRAMGGREMTAYGLAHLGDYQATVFSPYSHNRSFGEAFVQGKPFAQLAEGVPTVTALLELGARYRVELPICRAVDDVIHHQRAPALVLDSLFARSIKMEF